MLLYFYGDNERYFDAIYVSALIVSCVFCWQDKDALGAMIAVIAYFIISELFYAIPDSLVNAFCIYIACLILSLYFFRDVTAKILLAYVIMTMGVEIYWLQIEYANKPRMLYYISTMALTIGLRQLLYQRVFIMSEYFGYSSSRLRLDIHVGLIFYAFYILVALMAGEYFIRHLLGVKSALFIYNIYTPVSNFLSALTLCVVYMNYFYNQSQKQLNR